MRDERWDGDVLRVRSWASDLEEQTMQQALRTARSPIVTAPVALMPDAHVGLGATVGSVVVTETGLAPAAVGVDIGCGMVAIETSASAGDLPDDLGGMLADIGRTIPAGLGNWHAASSRAAERWLAGDRPPREAAMDAKTLRRAGEQLGTLGGGNHFVEVCVDERDRVWGVLHSGSRGVGNQLAQAHIREAKRLAKALNRPVDDPDLAYLLEGDPQFDAYVADMLWAQRWALANREIMADALLRVLVDHVPGLRETDRINAHHNYAVREVHDDREVWVTRKGAIRAGAGDRGIIPGSMGTGTFIVTGKGNPLSYQSASHGAGRRHSRSQARKLFSAEELTAAMAGRTWQADAADKLIDESPMAYKPIETVMADQDDLVAVDHRLEAVLNYKGTS
jgi:tRNA-splicing ligase RtcB